MHTYTAMIAFTAIIGFPIYVMARLVRATLASAVPRLVARTSRICVRISQKKSKDHLTPSCSALSRASADARAWSVRAVLRISTDARLKAEHDGEGQFCPRRNLVLMPMRLVRSLPREAAQWPRPHRFGSKFLSRWVDSRTAFLSQPAPGLFTCQAGATYRYTGLDQTSPVMTFIGWYVIFWPVGIRDV